MRDLFTLRPPGEEPVLNEVKELGMRDLFTLRPPGEGAGMRASRYTLGS